MLSGDENDTNVRQFPRTHQWIFQRGSVDAFLLAVPRSDLIFLIRRSHSLHLVRRSLGSLNFIHIWHDNAGLSNSASWFLKQIIVRDLQTTREDYFVCQRWLAVEHDDGKVR